jgi:hypothetical protein
MISVFFSSGAVSVIFFILSSAIHRFVAIELTKSSKEEFILFIFFWSCMVSLVNFFLIAVFISHKSRCNHIERLSTSFCILSLLLSSKLAIYTFKTSFVIAVIVFS